MKKNIETSSRTNRRTVATRAKLKFPSDEIEAIVKFIEWSKVRLIERKRCSGTDWHITMEGELPITIYSTR